MSKQRFTRPALWEDALKLADAIAEWPPKVVEKIDKDQLKN
jgi:hypothetical protein